MQYLRNLKRLLDLHSYVPTDDTVIILPKAGNGFTSA